MISFNIHYIYTMNSFFNTNEPYEIAKKITSYSDLSSDLVGHVYLIMAKKNNIEDVKNFFSKCCWIEFTKPRSSFNKKYRPVYTTEVIDNITTSTNDEWIESEYKRFLKEYIENIPSGECNEEWFKRQIAKFTLMGMTQQEIQSEYGIKQWYVSETLKQFRKDVLDNYIRSCGGEDSPGV